MKQASVTTCVARRGFTFTEVMFAVIILGVGFVMIAAILPVAIQQSKLGVDEATAAAVTQAAVNTVTIAAPAKLLFAPTGASATAYGKVYFFGDSANALAVAPFYTPDKQINTLCGNMIFGSDPRFGWIGFYQRDTANSNFAHLTILTIQSRNTETFSLNGSFPSAYQHSVTSQPTRVDSTNSQYFYGSAAPQPGTFAPKSVWVYLTERVDQPDLLTFVATNTGGGAVIEPHAGEGAFVIIAADPTPGTRPGTGTNSGALNGKVYRLGQAHPEISQGTYELQTGYDMYSDNITANFAGYNENIPYVKHDTNNRAVQTTGSAARAYICGRAMAVGNIAEGDPVPPNGTPNSPTGAVQDVSVYQCIVPIPQ